MTLAVQGLLLSLLSARDDMVYDYKALKWDSDESFFAFMDRLGVSGALYTIIGLFVAFDSVNLESIAYLLTTVYGSILTAFLFANSLDSEIYNAIGIVLTGMVALGFSFLFMQRMNEEDGIYETAEYQDPGSTDDGPRNLPAMVDLDEGVDDEGEDELESELAALDLDAEEDELEIDLEVLDEAGEEEEDLEIDLVDDAEDEEEETAPEPVVEQKVEETKPVQAPKPKKAHSGLLDTGEGFALRLPKDAVQNILSSLEQTPHEGYVPVVAFGPNGQIMLTFETDNTNA